MTRLIRKSPLPPTGLFRRRGDNVSKKHKKQDDKPDEEQGGRLFWLKISVENWFSDGTIREIMKPRNGKTYAMILMHLYLIALHGEEIGRVMEGLTPARMDRQRKLANYMRFRPKDVEDTIKIGRELGLIVVIDTEIWMRNIHRYVGSDATRKSKHENYLRFLLERMKKAGKPDTATMRSLAIEIFGYPQSSPAETSTVLPETPANITGTARDTGKYYGCLQRHGENERDRTGSQPRDREERSERSLLGSANPLSGVGQSPRVEENLETSKGLAAEEAGDVKPSEAMKKILDDIGEEPNPFNGNDGFKLEW